MSRVNRPGGDKEAGDMMGDKRDGNKLGDKPLFASVLHKESINKKVNFRTLVTNNTDLADVLIPMSSILEVHTMFENNLYRFVYCHHMYAIFEVYGLCMSFGDIRADQALKNIMVISVPNLIRNGVTMHTINVEYEWKPSRCGTHLVFGHDDMGTISNHSLTKQQMPKSTYQKKKASTLVSNASSALEEDNGKHMDDLVDDTQKKIEAPLKKTPRKTGIWSGRKADSPKWNLVYSPKTKVHYFDRDGMEFFDMGQAME
ncbi:hypothetical protein Tco_0371147 [Tanacetum coccineum]